MRRRKFLLALPQCAADYGSKRLVSLARAVVNLS